jgi:anti-sigma B factor antagonist
MTKNDFDRLRPLIIDVEDVNGQQVIHVHGDLDISATDSLRKALGLAMTEGGGPVIVDMVDLDFIDSSGLGVLVAARNLAQQHEVDFACVCDPDGHVRRVFSVSQVDQVVRIYPTLADALTQYEA